MQSYTPEDIALLTQLKAKGKTVKEIATALGRSRKSIEKQWSRIRSAYQAPREQNAATLVTEGNAAEAYTAPGRRVKSLEDLITEANIDLTVWDVERWVANKWEVGSFVDGVAITEPLYQVKAWLKRKPVSTTDITEIFEKAARESGRSRVRVHKSAGARKLLELSIPDLHVGKYAWGDETGHGDWDSALACEAYSAAVDALLAKVNLKDIEQILLPVGSDFFNVDNAAKTTSAGTPQDEDSRWQKSFSLGCDLLIKTVEKLATIAPVRVVVVPGNHDTERSFYAGAVLAAHFRGVKDIDIDNRPVSRKYHHYGVTLVGLTHGDRIKSADLANLAQYEQREAWGASRYCEWHLGHLHRESSIETAGCIIRVVPALCPPDAWHSKSGYVMSARGAQAFVYDRAEGLEAIIYHRRKAS
jgi:hypothetical protein